MLIFASGIVFCQKPYFYLVLTYGKRHGGGAELAWEFLASFQRQADYINTIMMVDNYLPGFDMEEQLTIPAKNPQKRYHNESVRLTEIVEANDQRRR